ncbi:MAG: DNA translocase FtsK, partial [Vulcanimicrobiaceae bacterium]
MRLNLEIAGIAAFGLAMLTAFAIVAPTRSGALGAQAAHGLHLLFGGAAGLFPILIFLIAGIVFLEINVPRLIASFGGAALGYFLIVDALLGGGGGIVGRGFAGALAGLLGVVGATVLLIFAALLITVAITNVSVKKVIGWTIARAVELRARTRRASPANARVAAARPGTLREAFNLPVPVKPAPIPVGRAEPARAVALIEPATPATVEDDDEYEDDEELEDGYDDEADVDDEYEDEDDEEETDEEAEEDKEADDGDAAVTPAAAGPAARRAYRLPDLALFDPPQAQIVDESTRAHVLEDTLGSFGVGAKVVHIERGPSITRYELKPERGVKISRISSLADDLALALAATSVRIEAPIPGKSAVGIEIPNATVSTVAIAEILQSLPQRGVVPPLNMALGKDITGRPVFGDLGKMPHLLVAGATGSGKSVCLNGIIASLLVCATPDQVQMLFIDPKRVELT